MLTKHEDTLDVSILSFSTLTVGCLGGNNQRDPRPLPRVQHSRRVLHLETSRAAPCYGQEPGAERHPGRDRGANRFGDRRRRIHTCYSPVL
jgi:hypothetical protein